MICYMWVNRYGFRQSALNAAIHTGPVAPCPQRSQADLRLVTHWKNPWDVPRNMCAVPCPQDLNWVMETDRLIMAGIHHRLCLHSPPSLRGRFPPEQHKHNIRLLWQHGWHKEHPRRQPYSKVVPDKDHIHTCKYRRCVYRDRFQSWYVCP